MWVLGMELGSSGSSTASALKPLIQLSKPPVNAFGAQQTLLEEGEKEGRVARNLSLSTLDLIILDGTSYKNCF